MQVLPCSSRSSDMHAGLLINGPLLFLQHCRLTGTPTQQNHVALLTVGVHSP